jgi:hypothetical protein
MASLPLITPSDCAVVLVDYQAGLAFAAGSADRNGPVVTYRKGKGFSEMPGDRHAVSENASETDPAKLLAVFVVDTDEKELTTPYAK